MSVAIMNISKRVFGKILGLGDGVVVQVVCQPDSPDFDIVIEHPEFPAVPESGALQHFYLTTTITSCEHGGTTNTHVAADFNGFSVELSDSQKDSKALFDEMEKERKHA